MENCTCHSNYNVCIACADSETGTLLAGDYFVFPLWFSALISILSAIVVILNILHIIIIFRLPSLKKPSQKNYKLFLIALGFVDIISCICNSTLSPPEVQDYMKKSRLLCISSAAILHSAYVNMGSLTILIAIDRVLSICHSLNYHRHCFVMYFRRYALAAGIFIVAVYLALAIVFRDVGYEPKGNGPCKMGTRKAPFLGMITAVWLYSVLLTLMITYVVFLYMVKKYLIGKSGRNWQESKEIAQVVGLIILSHIVLWTPPLVNVALRSVGMKIPEMEYVTILMMLLNSTANPLIYGVSSPTYRRGLKSAINLNSNSLSPERPSEQSASTNFSGSKSVLKPL